ncbi:MAG: hypothetical protein H0X66_07615 [Verrucomicrobia bacterium]|nr:hypothetical protein [Verrucomicrobiota bacterium]
MSRLTALEISLRHGVCSSPGCAICAELPMENVAGYLNQIGFHVRDYSDDHKTAFGFVEVLEDEETCSRLLKNQNSSPEGRTPALNPMSNTKESWRSP